MFTTHPPFAYEHTDDSILARLRCDLPPTMAYKEQPIHSFAAERTRRFSLPAPDRMAVDQALGIERRPFSTPKRSQTTPGETVHGDGKTYRATIQAITDKYQNALRPTGQTLLV